MSCQPCQNCGGPGYVPQTLPTSPPPCNSSESCHEVYSSSCVSYVTQENLYNLEGTVRIKDVLDLLVSAQPNAVINAMLDSIESDPELKAKFQALMN